MIANIRGALGTQVLELIGCYCWAAKHSATIDEIHINISGNIVDTAKVDYVSDIFHNLPTVRLVQEQLKYGIWKDSKLEFIFNHHPTNLHLKYSKKESNTQILHIRASDHFPVSIEKYIRLAYENDCVIIGDNPRVCGIVADESGREYITQSPVADWFLCLQAKKIFCSRSSFPLSAAYFDQMKIIKYFDKEDGDRRHSREARELYNIIFSEFPNAEAIEDKS